MLYILMAIIEWVNGSRIVQWCFCLFSFFFFYFSMSLNFSVMFVLFYHNFVHMDGNKDIDASETFKSWLINSLLISQINNHGFWRRRTSVRNLTQKFHCNLDSSEIGTHCSDPCYKSHINWMSIGDTLLSISNSRSRMIDRTLTRNIQWTHNTSNTKTTSITYTK